MLGQYKEQILEIIVTGLVFGLILTVIEVLKRRNVLGPWISRKVVHICVGLVLACLPLFMGNYQIVVTNLAFFLGVTLLSGVFHVFTSIHPNHYRSVGEYVYPLTTALVALVFDDLRIYSYSVLILALGDGLAGLIGQKYGGKGFRVWKGHKTLLGSMTFWVVATLITMAFWTATLGWSWVAFPISAMLGLLLALIEALTTRGLDNIAVTFSAAVCAWFILTI